MSITHEFMISDTSPPAVAMMVTNLETLSSVCKTIDHRKQQQILIPLNSPIELFQDEYFYSISITFVEVIKLLDDECIHGLAEILFYMKEGKKMLSITVDSIIASNKILFSKDFMYIPREILKFQGIDND